MAIALKLFKSIKRRAKLRRKKAIRPKGKFKAHGANPLKSYRRRRTDAEVLAYAKQCRMERLRSRTRAELRLSELLDTNRVLYESEKIFLNGDRHILADFYIPAAMLVIEVDGSAHDNQKSYDAGRDRWLLSQYGVRTMRLSNSDVMKAKTETIRKFLAHSS